MAYGQLIKVNVIIYETVSLLPIPKPSVLDFPEEYLVGLTVNFTVDGTIKFQTFCMLFTIREELRNIGNTLSYILYWMPKLRSV